MNGANYAGYSGVPQQQQTSPGDALLGFAMTILRLNAAQAELQQREQASERSYQVQLQRVQAEADYYRKMIEFREKELQYKKEALEAETGWLPGQLPGGTTTGAGAPTLVSPSQGQALEEAIGRGVGEARRIRTAPAKETVSGPTPTKPAAAPRPDLLGPPSKPGSAVYGDIAGALERMGEPGEYDVVVFHNGQPVRIKNDADIQRILQNCINLVRNGNLESAVQVYRDLILGFQASMPDMPAIPVPPLLREIDKRAREELSWGTANMPPAPAGRPGTIRTPSGVSPPR